MLLMPYLKQVVRPYFPVGVVLLVAINLAVFFGFQQRDEGRYRIAFDYYEHSILVKLEPPAYLDFLRQNGQDKRRVKFQKLQVKGDLPHVVLMMEDDAEFMRALRAERIVNPEHPDYAQWRQARRYYESVVGAITIERYAFNTDRPSLLTAFTHQFLHGDLGHLAGNMVVLVLIAPAVEALLGTPLFLLVYLIGGLGAVGAHWLIAGGGSGLVGASGAISAAMGAFAVLLRWRRIPFFYFVVVYFDIIRAPALLALPIWLVNEALQLFWFGDQHIAYGAHIGGLLTGGLLAWPLLRRAESRLLPDRPEGAETSAEDRERLLQRHLAQARSHMRNHAYDQARRAYALAAANAGDDPAVWRECLNVVKLSPASQEFHQVVRTFLKSSGADHELLLDTFREYLRLAQPRPNLDAKVLTRLADRFLRHGCTAELERAARLLHAVAPEHPRCREILLAAASGCHGAGNRLKAEELTRLAESAALA